MKEGFFELVEEMKICLEGGGCVYVVDWLCLCFLELMIILIDLYFLVFEIWESEIVMKFYVFEFLSYLV